MNVRYFALVIFLMAFAANADENNETAQRIATILIEHAAAGEGVPPECTDGNGQPGSTPTLASDLGYHLASLAQGGGRVTGTCEVIPEGKQECTLVIGQQLGELEWARHYRFHLNVKGKMIKGTLTCFTVP